MTIVSKHVAKHSTKKTIPHIQRSKEYPSRLLMFATQQIESRKFSRRLVRIIFIPPLKIYNPPKTIRDLKHQEFTKCHAAVVFYNFVSGRKRKAGADSIEENGNSNKYLWKRNEIVKKFRLTRRNA